MAEKTDIEQDINRTRQQMSGTVNEIQDRLSPKHIKDEAKERLRTRVSETASRLGETARGAGSSVVESARGAGNTFVDWVKANPVPVAMIGIGLGWLMISRTAAGNKVAESGSRLKSRAGEMTDTAQAKMEEMSGQVREAGSEFAGRATQTAQRFAGAARQQAYAAQSRFQAMIHDNPLGIALAFFGIGALLGFSIPETRKEQEIMGSASESLLSRAKETAQKTIHKAQQAAEKAVHTAEEEFKKTA